jgi:hypothetical protein
MILVVELQIVAGNPNYNIPHEQLMSLLIRKLSVAFANSGGNINDYGLPKIDV